MIRRIEDELASSPTLAQELEALTRELGLSTPLREELDLLADEYRALAAQGPDRLGSLHQQNPHHAREGRGVNR